jgi:hypothetical protein
MKTISQIIAGAQALFNISFNLTGCFEEYLPDEYKTFLQVLRVIEERLPALTRPYAGTGRLPYRYTPFIRGFLARGYFGIEKTSRLIRRLKGHPVSPCLLPPLEINNSGNTTFQGIIVNDAGDISVNPGYASVQAATGGVAIVVAQVSPALTKTPTSREKVALPDASVNPHSNHRFGRALKPLHQPAGPR